MAQFSWTLLPLSCIADGYARYRFQDFTLPISVLPGNQVGFIGGNAEFTGAVLRSSVYAAGTALLPAVGSNSLNWT